MKKFLFCIIATILAWAPYTSYAGVARLVADTKSGLILVAENDQEPKYPASLTKVMTLYITFWALENKLIQMDDLLPISKNAEKQPRSKLYLKAGTTMTVYEAIMALIIKSANDAAVVLAEALANSESEFADIMTQTARQLGLTHTTFKNASGLHHPEQQTTARDMAVLTIALINHYPQYYALFSTPFFEYNGKRYYSHNNILKNYDGAEGLKTGFISAGGYSIISTAQKEGTRLVTVVLGHDSVNLRDKTAMRLLDTGFEKVRHRDKYFARLAKKGQNPLEKNALVPKAHLEYRFAAIQERLNETKRLADRFRKNQTLAPELAGMPVVEVGIAQGDGSWGIQVGAFHHETIARETAERVLSLLDNTNKHIKTPRFEQFFRSRIFGFTSSRDANIACQKLKSRKIQCFPVGPDY